MIRIRFPGMTDPEITLNHLFFLFLFIIFIEEILLAA